MKTQKNENKADLVLINAVEFTTVAPDSRMTFRPYAQPIMQESLKLLRPGGTAVVIAKTEYGKDFIQHQEKELPLCYRAIWLNGRQFEDVLVFSKHHNPEAFSPSVPRVYSYESDGLNDKPVAFLEDIICSFSKENDIVVNLLATNINCSLISTAIENTKRQWVVQTANNDSLYIIRKYKAGE